MQINLGNIYNQGLGVDVDKQRAKEYYAQAAVSNEHARGLLEKLEAQEAAAGKEAPGNVGDSKSE